MQQSFPDIIAFDFDGVICDGLIEYFETAWRAYCQLFKANLDAVPAGLSERFSALRPVIETGWEMPVMLQALVSGVSDRNILDQWPQMALPYLEAVGLTPKDAAIAVDTIRDRWIQTDLDEWLGLHRFYPGLLTVLQRALATCPTYIVSTKEGRFIQQLLYRNGVRMGAELILGKEVKQPKYQTLRQLLITHRLNEAEETQFWFIEDRLNALQAVKAQPDLDAVTLFLADWGYNLETDRALAQQDDRIHLLSLEQIVQKL